MLLLHFKNNKRGFTLFEMMVTASIIILLSAVVLSRGFSDNSKMRGSDTAFLDTVKEVRQMSLSVKQFYASGVFPNYGIEFDMGNPTQMKIYADCSADDNADSALNQNDRFTYAGSTQYPGLGSSCPAPQPSGFIEDRTLLYGTKITALRVYNSADTLLFSPTRAYMEYFRPEPTIWIAFIDASGAQQVLDVGRLEVEITSASNVYKKTISITTTGRITMQ
jgi:prepilin-type N-terminal cleavage/methylation domain-containing protein